ncbi:MAG: putative oxidoreductase [Lentisphaeria bacterium]|jgi:putative oxidoreductase
MKILTTINSYAKKVSDIVPEWLVALTIRASLFFVFWKSVQTKISGFSIGDQNFAFWGVTDTTIAIFEYEYDLPLLPPEIAAYLATFGEFFLSIGLLLGFMTRLSALGLLLMTMVIQIFVYWDAWPIHILWAGGLLYLLKNGPSKISVDSILRQA